MRTIQIGGDAFPAESWDEMKNRVLMRLVNTERNKEELERVPHIEWNDLSIVFYIPIECWDNVNTSMIVNNAIMQTWGVNTDAVYEAAAHNTPVELYAMQQSLREVVNNIAEEIGQAEDMIPANPAVKDDNIRILTNQKMLNGAAVILYDGIMEAVAEEWQSDVFILPSSIHEVIIIKPEMGDDPDGLVNMVRSVNKMEDAVREDEILSDNIYRYSRQTGKIEMYQGK